MGEGADEARRAMSTRGGGAAGREEGSAKERPNAAAAYARRAPQTFSMSDQLAAQTYGTAVQPTAECSLTHPFSSPVVPAPP